jgi:hypothetical protein
MREMDIRRLSPPRRARTSPSPRLAPLLSGGQSCLLLQRRGVCLSRRRAMLESLLGLMAKRLQDRMAPSLVRTAGQRDVDRDRREDPSEDQKRDSDQRQNKIGHGNPPLSNAVT